MMRDAQDHADEDKRRRDEAETRNQAEALLWQTEKFLAENGDKIPEDSKTEINEALGDLRAALGGNDSEKIKSAHEQLSTASQKAGTALYQQAQAAQASAGETPFGDAGAGADASTSGESSGGPSFTKEAPADDVVDAEIIDEDDKK
jgi:molecular chaperone DnaK